MGATFSRVKNWTTETLSNTDLNAEIDNILNNLGPSGVDDYSTSTSQMRLTTDPGEVGSESLATSLSGELERIRFAIKEIKGTGSAQWYSTPTASLTDVIAAVGGSVVSNRIVSGATSTNSSSPRFLIAGNTTASITLDASPTSFVYYINGVQYTATADTTFGSMNGAPNTNNTALVNDPSLTGQESSKWMGEDGSTLNIDTAGTEITNLTGKYAAFQIVSGGATEYFIGYVKSSTQITNCLRGCFFNSSLAAIPRIGISDNNTISVMSLAWIFANTSASLAVSYVNPILSYSTPSSTTGYWFDMGTNVWKTYSGAAWITANSTLIGFACLNQTATKGVRCIDFFGNWNSYSNLSVEYAAAGQLQAKNYGSKVSVGTSIIDFKCTKPTWDMATDIESGYGETASLSYFAYIGESGQIKMSPEKPYYSADLGRGWYHPYENWRAVASIYNNSSSDFVQNSLKMYSGDPNANLLPQVTEFKNIGVGAVVASNELRLTIQSSDGSPLSPANPAYVAFRGDQTIGTTVIRTLTQNINVTVPSGASLGHIGGVNQYTWVHLIDNSGTIDAGVVGQRPISDAIVQSSTQLTATATVAGTFYSQGPAVTSKATRYVARLTTNEAAAGTWATAPSEIAMQPPLVLNLENWGQVSRTISFNNFTPSTANFGYITRRMGDTLEVAGYVQSGASQPAAAFALVLPTGITADDTKLYNAGPRNGVGEFRYLDNGAGLQFGVSPTIGCFFVDSSVSLVQLGAANAGTGKQFQYQNSSVLFPGTSAAWSFAFRVPVKGWSTYGP